MHFSKHSFIGLLVVSAIVIGSSPLHSVTSAQNRQPAGKKVSEREMRQRKLAERGFEPINDAGYARSLMAAAARERKRNAHRLPGAPVNLAAGDTLELWSNIGPRSANEGHFDSGRLSSIVTHPSNSNIIYVASAGGGVWKTVNGGSTWTPMTELVGSLGCGALAMDPFDPDTLYLGLGDPHRIGFLGLGTAPGLGVLKTTDGGVHWSAPVLLGDSTNIRSIVVNIFDDDKILVGTDKGLFRSGDAGGSYQQVQVAGSNTPNRIWSVLWAGGANYVMSGEPPPGGIGEGAHFGPVLDPPKGRIWTSSDEGQTWALATGFDNDLGVITLAVAPSNRNTLYALAERVDAAEIYKSINAGQSWTSLSIGTKKYTNYEESVDKILGSQGDYNQMAIVYPTNSNTAYFGGQKRLIKTVNGGNTFSLVSSDNPQSVLFDYVHADIHCAAFTDSGALLVGSDGGIFKSTNGGANWSSSLNDGLITHLVYAVASTKDDWNVIVATLQDNGVMIRRQNNGAFDKIKTGDGDSAVVSQSDSNKMLFSTNGGVYQSGDGGSTHAAASTIGLTGAAPNRWEQSYHDATGNFLYAISVGKLYKSANLGLSWHAVGTTGIPANVTVKNVASSKVPGALIIIVSNGGAEELYYTVDAGSHWTKAAAIANTNGVLIDAAIGPDLQFYVIADGYEKNTARIWTSNDPQTAWAPVAWGGLPDGVRLNVIKADPVKDGVIYVGSDLGAYRSQNKGLTFDRWGYGLPLVSVTDIWIAADGSVYRVGTYGRGVWHLVVFAGFN